MKIAVDLDGTLADVIKVWIAVYNQRYEAKLTYDEINRWEFWRELKVSSQEFRSILTEAWGNWRVIPKTQRNLLDSLNKLGEIGVVDIVTARTPDTIEFVRLWLAYHHIPYNSLVVVPPWSGKDNLHYDVYIDDSPKVASKVASKEKLVLLYNRPWNSLVKEGPWIKRIRKLSEASSHIKKLAHVTELVEDKC